MFRKTITTIGIMLSVCTTTALMVGVWLVGVPTPPDHVQLAGLDVPAPYANHVIHSMADLERILP